MNSMWLDPVTHRPVTRWTELRRTIACKLGRHRWSHHSTWFYPAPARVTSVCYDCGKRVQS